MGLIVDASRVWKSASSLLEKELSVKDYETWIRDLRARSYDDNTLTLEAPFGLYRERIRSQFIPALERAVSAVVEEHCRVALYVDEKSAETRMQRPAAPALVQHRVHRAPNRHSSTLAPRLKTRTFENFVVGDSNRMAYLAAQNIVDGSLGGVNPVFIYGDVGLGKTHLLMAVVHALRSRGGRVLYYSGEEFTQLMVDALKNEKMDRFRREFQLADALLIDDVQCMVGKKRTQQELGHAFNLLHAAGKPIAFASDRSPNEIQTFEQGLKNRFQGGLITELRAPDKGLRASILRSKLKDNGIELADSLIDRVAALLSGSVREIEGVVANIRLAASNSGGQIEDAVVDAVIAPFLKSRGPVTVETVIETVGWSFGVSREEILSRARTRRVSLPRHVVAYLCRKLTPASSTEIGDALGGRNHTSVLRAEQWIRERACDDPGFAGRLGELERMLGGSQTRAGH